MLIKALEGKHTVSVYSLHSSTSALDNVHLGVFLYYFTPDRLGHLSTQIMPLSTRIKELWFTQIAPEFVLKLQHQNMFVHPLSECCCAQSEALIEEPLHLLPHEVKHFKIRALCSVWRGCIILLADFTILAASWRRLYLADMTAVTDRRQLHGHQEGRGLRGSREVSGLEECW